MSDVPRIEFQYPKQESPGKIKIPPLFKEMGFGRPNAIRHPKGLWLIEIWQCQAFKADTNTNEKIIVTVIASPKGAAISSLLGIASSLRSSQ
jgi:hypothetical protein